MFSLSTTSLRIRRLTSLVVAALAIASLVAMVAPAASMPSNAANNDLLAQYGWGAAATLAKQQTRTAVAASADNDLLAQYGWGAAATFAKLHA